MFPEWSYFVSPYFKWSDVISFQNYTHRNFRKPKKNNLFIRKAYLPILFLFFPWSFYLENISTLIFLLKTITQGELLDGHSIELKQSNRAVVDPKAGKRKAVERTKQGKCTKVLVRNIPFEVGYFSWSLKTWTDYYRPPSKKSLICSPLSEKFEPFAFLER